MWCAEQSRTTGQFGVWALPVWQDKWRSHSPESMASFWVLVTWSCFKMVFEFEITGVRTSQDFKGSHPPSHRTVLKAAFWQRWHSGKQQYRCWGHLVKALATLSPGNYCYKILSRESCDGPMAHVQNSSLTCEDENKDDNLAICFLSTGDNAFENKQNKTRRTWSCWASWNHSVQQLICIAWRVTDLGQRAA